MRVDTFESLDMLLLFERRRARFTVKLGFPESLPSGHCGVDLGSYDCHEYVVVAAAGGPVLGGYCYLR